MLLIMFHFQMYRIMWSVLVCLFLVINSTSDIKGHSEIKCSAKLVIYNSVKNVKTMYVHLEESQ